MHHLVHCFYSKCPDFIIAVYLHFFHVYLNISKRKWLIYAAYAYAFILMCFTPTSLYIVSAQQHYFGYFAKAGILFPLFDAASLFVNIYVLTLILTAIRTEKSNTRKNNLKYVLAGFGIMGLLNALDVFPLHGYSVYPPGNASFIPLIVFAVGIYKHHILPIAFAAPVEVGTIFNVAALALLRSLWGPSSNPWSLV